MRISDVLSVFDADVTFFRMNDRPFDVRHYSGLRETRWARPTGQRWVAVALTANFENEAALGWDQAFAMYHELPAKPEAIVFILVGTLGQVPIPSVLRRAEECGLQFIAAFPLRYDVAKAALVAVPTEVPIATHRWLAQGDPLSPPNESTARRVYSQHILSDAVRRAQQQITGREQSWNETLDENRDSSRYELAERDARRRERQLNAAFTREIQELQTQLRAAEENFRAVKTSSAYRLGNLLGKSVRRPLWALVGFPRELIRIIGDRPRAAARSKAAQGSPRDAGPDEVPFHGPSRESVTSIPDNDYKFAVPITGSEQFSAEAIAHIAHPFYGGIRRSAWQFDLLPNNWKQQLEMRVPNLICIDASATLVGSPWSGAGTGIDPPKTSMLVDIAGYASRFGIPCLFRWDVPAHRAPILNRISEICDLIVVADPSFFDSDLPIVPHGIAAEMWSPNLSAKPMSSIALIDMADLTDTHGFRYPSGDQLAKLGPDWTVLKPSPAIIHRPIALRALYWNTGVVVLPMSSSLTLPALEALASGRPVIGFRNNDFAHLHHPNDLEWQENDLWTIQSHALADSVDTAWSIRSRYSTISETRSFGRLLSDPAMQSVGSITAVIGDDDWGSGQIASVLDLVAPLIEQLIVISQPEDKAKGGRIATLAESVGVTAWVADTWSDGARLAKKVTPTAGVIWTLSVGALSESPDTALKRCIVSPSPGEEIPRESHVFSAMNLRTMSDEEAGTILSVVAARPMAT